MCPRSPTAVLPRSSAPEMSSSFLSACASRQVDSAGPSALDQHNALVERLHERATALATVGLAMIELEQRQWTELEHAAVDDENEDMSDDEEAAEQVNFHTNFTDSEFCTRVENYSNTWDEWQPSDPAQILIKRSIDNINI